MIPTVELLYDLDRKLNKIATNKNQSIELENKIIALNEAQIQLIKKKIDVNNVYALGFDGFKKRYEDLECLVVPEEQVTPVKDENSKLFKYLINTGSLAKGKYMFYLDLYCLAEKGSCKDWPINTNVIKHADVQRALGNNNTKPSFEYQEVPVTISSNQIEIYTEEDFLITSAYVTYIRYPQRIDKEGFINFDESESADSDSELPYYLKDEIVDLAVRELAMSTENQAAVQYSQLRIQNDE